MRNENKEGSDTLQAPCLFSFFRLGYATSYPDPLSTRPHPSLFSTPLPLWEWSCSKWMYFHFIFGKRMAKVSSPVVVRSVPVDYFETFRLLSLVFIDFLIVTKYTQQSSSVDADSTYKSPVTSFTVADVLHTSTAREYSQSVFFPELERQASHEY
jgi:hypothetical protein